MVAALSAFSLLAKLAASWTAQVVARETAAQLAACCTTAVVHDGSCAAGCVEVAAQSLNGVQVRLGINLWNILRLFVLRRGGVKRVGFPTFPPLSFL